MKTLEQLAQDLNNGLMNAQMVSPTMKGGYILWNIAVGTQPNTKHHLYYKFGKMLSKDAAKNDTQYPDAYFFRHHAISADWKTQAAATYMINDLRRGLRDAVAAEAMKMPFGKYQGQRIDAITDLDYLCWMANQKTKQESRQGIDEWIRNAARERATYLGALSINSKYIDPTSEHRYNKNTVTIYNAIQNDQPIEYIAEQNDGGIWCAYGFNLPTIACGHPYYGVSYCLNVDDRARKAKGLRIVIVDYTVNDGVITPVNFYVERA